MTEAHFFVYVLASRSRVLYTGVTRDLVRRAHQHRLGEVPGFTQQYKVNRLVYFEETPSARSAFDRRRLAGQVAGLEPGREPQRWLNRTFNFFASNVLQRQ